MRAFGGRQPGSNSLRLRVVSAAVDMLEGVDGGQYEGRAESARKPGQRARPKAGPQFRHTLIDRRDVVPPVLGMSLLDRRQAVVNLRQLRVLLGLRENPVEGRAVNLALKIGRVAPSSILFRHRGFCAGLSE